MTASDQESWLRLLARYRALNGAPSLRDLAGPVGKSHTHLAAIFRGQRTPKRDDLIKLGRALGMTDEHLQAVMDAYDREHPPGAPGAGPPGGHPSLVLARAVDNLADAIRDLARVQDSS